MADGKSEGIYASLQRSPHHPDLVKSPHELQDGLSLDSQPNFGEELGLTHSDLQFLHDSNPFDGLPDTILDHLDICSDLWPGTEGNGSGHTDSFPQRNNTEGVSSAPFDISQHFPSSFPSSKDQLDDLLRDTLGLQATSDRLPEPCGSNETLETGNHKRSTSHKSSINGVLDFADEPFRPAKRQCRDGPVDRDDNRYMLPNTAGEVSRETPYTAGESHGINDSPGAAFTGESDDLNSLFSEWDLDLKETSSNPTRQSSSDPFSIHSKISAQPASSEKPCDAYARTSSQHPLALPEVAHQPTSIAIQPPSTAYGDSRSYRHTSVDSLFDDTTPDGPGVFQNHEAFSPLASDTQDQTLSHDSTSTSCQILKKNDLQEDDLVSTRVREVIRNTQAVSKYISPYPRVGGSLGYLPSNPTLHVKCVEVAEDEVVARLESYRKNVRTLAREKNKYMWANEEWKKANLGAGKSNEQVLKEELMCLRRALNAKDKKAKEALEEAAAWRNEYRKISFFYSNLLHRVAPRSAINRPMATPNKPPNSQAPAPLPSSQNGNSPNPDATVQHDNEKASAANAAKLPSIQPNVEALTAMQKRQYNWLPGQNPLQKNIRPRPHAGNQYGREGSQQTPSSTSSPSGNQHKSGESTNNDNSVIEVEG